MQNQIITNKQGSIVELSPLQDAHGAALVLRPRGEKGDTREITAETAGHEIIERVVKAGWVSLRGVTNTPPAPLAPKIELPIELPADATPVDATLLEAPVVVPEEAPVVWVVPETSEPVATPVVEPLAEAPVETPVETPVATSVETAPATAPAEPAKPASSKPSSKSTPARK